MVSYDEKIKEIVLDNINFFKNREIKIGVSNRHVHLSQDYLDALFGKGYELTPMKPLSQPGQYACEETLTLKGKKGFIENVRILGPVREKTQVEILNSDIYKLGIKAPVRLSGDLENTPGIILISNKNAVKINEGVIVAKRHIHMIEEQSKALNLRDGQEVNVEIKGERGAIFNNVIIRVSKKSYLEMHIDMDESNAFQVKNKDLGYLIL